MDAYYQFSSTIAEINKKISAIMMVIYDEIFEQIPAWSVDQLCTVAKCRDGVRNAQRNFLYRVPEGKVSFKEAVDELIREFSEFNFRRKAEKIVYVFLGMEFRSLGIKREFADELLKHEGAVCTGKSDIITVLDDVFERVPFLRSPSDASEEEMDEAVEDVGSKSDEK